MSIEFLTPLTKEEKELLLLALSTSELVGEIALEWSTETEETEWNIDFDILREKLKNCIGED